MAQKHKTFNPMLSMTLGNVLMGFNGPLMLDFLKHAGGKNGLAVTGAILCGMSFIGGVALNLMAAGTVAKGPRSGSPEP